MQSAKSTCFQAGSAWDASQTSESGHDPRHDSTDQKLTHSGLFVNVLQLTQSTLECSCLRHCINFIRTSSLTRRWIMSRVAKSVRIWNDVVRRVREGVVRMVDAARAVANVAIAHSFSPVDVHCCIAGLTPNTGLLLDWCLLKLSCSLLAAS